MALLGMTMSMDGIIR